MPNYTSVTKGKSRASDVLERQSLNNGAYSARAMNRLQNYGHALLSYDDKAYALGSTYSARYLKMYATHPACCEMKMRHYTGQTPLACSFYLDRDCQSYI